MSTAPGYKAPNVIFPRVLLVDDSASARIYLRTILSGLAVVVEEATDGGEAFAILLSRQFDLLITDLNMAPVTGAQLVMAVQLLPPERRPKIIVCSADAGSSLPATRQVLQQADRHLAKPASARDLIAAVTALLPGAVSSCL